MSSTDGRSIAPRSYPESTPIRPRSTQRVSRKKACEQCSSSKLRCDLKRPHCSKCRCRRLQCQYAHPSYSQDRTTGSFETSNRQEMLTFDLTTDMNPPSGGSQAVLDPASQVQGSLGLPTPSSWDSIRISNPEPQRHDDVLSSRTVIDLTQISLVNTIDSSRVRNRWMQDLLPWPNERPKALTPGILQFLSRVLKTYPLKLANPGSASLPPIIHPSQLSTRTVSTPLANCLTLTRMFTATAPGSEALVISTITSEMDRLFQSHSSYSQLDLLGAFQAYLIYAIMLFFSPLHPATPNASPLITRETMINLQDLACTITNTGLACPAELTHSRPDYESWIVADTKRRTLYTMYMFDTIFSSLEGLPSFIAEELAGLPAPASKALWEAKGNAEWEREYNLHLGNWEGKGLTIDELWPIPVRTAVEARRGRVDRWLSDVDEFGMMLFAVTSVTHGC
jgi:hypothetical protein